MAMVTKSHLAAGLLQLLVLVLLTGLAGVRAAAAAGPTVAELLAACDRASVAGNAGLDAAACEWYAAPCACKLQDPNGGGPPWCIPEGEPMDAVVRKVVAALRDAPRWDAAVQAEIEVILGRLYPCAGAASH
jgi:hypothetical protein